MYNKTYNMNMEYMNMEYKFSCNVNINNDKIFQQFQHNSISTTILFCSYFVFYLLMF